MNNSNYFCGDGPTFTIPNWEAQAGDSGTYGTYVVQANDTIEPVTTDDNLFFKRIRIYPASSVVNGVPVQNTNDIYIGMTEDAVPDLRAPEDTDYPVIYEVDRQMPLSAIHVRGQIGDGVLYIYT